MPTDGSFSFKVVYPVTTTGPSSVTVGTSTLWTTTPTSLLTLTAIPAQVEVTTFKLDPAWWGTSKRDSWTVGLQGTAKTLTSTVYPITSTTESASPSSSIGSTVPSATSPSTISQQSLVESSSSSSSVASPTTTGDANTKHGGLSSGAAAGIGIGCAAAGAIVAAIAAWLLLRRKSSGSRGYRNDASRSPPSDAGSSIPDKSGSTMAMLPLATRNGDVNYFGLPPPESNSALANTFSRLDTMIKNHAFSFFGGGGTSTNTMSIVKHGQIDELLGSNASINAKQLAALLNGSQRVPAIRYLLGWAILSNIEANSSPDHTLLPPEIVEFLHSMRINGNPDPSLLSKWRHLTGVLVNSTYGSKAMGANDLRQDNINKMADTLDEVLATLTSSSKGLERRRNLEEIIKLGAQSGYILLTQPTAWELQWEDTRAKSGKDLVVFPELVQVEDDQGKLLERPQPYGLMQIVKIG